MTAPTDALVERLRGLLAKATPVRDTWRLRVKDDGEERYELIGDPCGFPVAIFGHHSDAELDLAFRFALPALLAERASLLARIEAAEKVLEPFVKIPLCYPRHKSRPQPAQLDTPAPANAYSAADVERARRLLS